MPYGDTRKYRLLIQINNDDDDYCLFYAIALTKYYLTMPKTDASKKYFERLVSKPGGKYKLLRRNMVGDLLRGVNRFLEECGEAPIPNDADEYDALDICPLIQRYLDSIEPHKFRISVFHEYGSYTPRWKGLSCAEFDLPIIEMADEHFHGVRQLNGFFGKDNFCVECERPFQTKAKHNPICRATCRGCMEKGFGRT